MGYAWGGLLGIRPPAQTGPLLGPGVGQPVPLAFTPDQFAANYADRLKGALGPPPERVTPLDPYAPYPGGDPVVQQLLARQPVTPGAIDASTQHALNSPFMGFALGLNDAAGVWHGSPHQFDQFDISKVGTGEGAQAYGQGMYFADRPSVAESYRLAGGQGPTVEYNGSPVVANSLKSRALQDVAEKGKESALANIDSSIKFNENYAPDMANIYRFIRDEVANADPSKINVNRGHLYRATSDINPEHMLDWDKPLSEQSPHVQDALKQAYPGMEGSQRTLQQEFPHGIQQAHAEVLNQAGIPGIRYLDQGSRTVDLAASDLKATQTQLATLQNMQRMSPTSKGTAAIAKAQGRIADLEKEISGATRNYVVFDPSRMRVLERNGQPVSGGLLGVK